MLTIRKGPGRRLPGFAGLVLTVLAVGLFAAPAVAQKKQFTPSGPRPPVSVDPGTFDFGKKDPNKLIHTVFKFTNTSNATLRVDRVQPSCHCTVPTLEKNTILPGETIEIEATLDLRGSIGDVAKDFMVFFEGYEGHPLRCKMKGKLAYVLEVEPSKPRLDRQPTGQLTITARDGEPFTVLAVHGEEPQVVAKRGETADGQAAEWVVRYDFRNTNARQWRMVEDGATVTWEPHTPGDSKPYMMLIETDREDLPVLDLRLWGREISKQEMPYIKNWASIFCNRNMANLGRLAKGESNEFGAAITRPEASHAERCRVFCPDPRVRVDVVGVEPVDGRPKDEQYTVRVTNVSDEEGMFLAPLIFECGTNPNNADFQTRMWIGGYFRSGDDVAVGQR